MPDAHKVTVDGVEPSILVELYSVSDNPLKVKVFTADDGTERYLEKGEPALLTPKDLGVLGIVSYKIVNDVDDEIRVKETKDEIPSEQTVVVSPVISTNPPGQPGQ